MTIQIALLRAVNVGGRKVLMTELKAMFAALGFTDAQTLLQSGNVVFDSARKAGASLESLLETEMRKRFQLPVDFMVRTAQEWQSVIARNPFPKEAENDPSHLLVVPLKSTPTSAAVASLQAAIKGREKVRATGREIYIVYPDGIGESKLTIGLIERRLDTCGTGRNWNTVLKLQALAESLSKLTG